MSIIDTVHRKLGHLRRGFKGWLLATTVALLVAILGWSLLLFAMGDLALQFRQVWCWTAWGLLLATLGATFAVGIRYLTRPVSDDSLCARIERLRPELKNRLINLVQLARSPEPRERTFAARLAEEQPLHVERLSAWAIFPRRVLQVGALMALIAIAGNALLFGLNQAGYLVAARRLLLPMQGLAPYTLTQILLVEPGDATVVRGQELHVSVRFGGVMPKQPVLVLQPGTSPRRTLQLVAVEGASDRFVATSPTLYETSAWWIEGGDARSARYTVQVVSPPALERWEATVQPPAYTRLPATTIDSTMDKAEARVGSRLDLRARASLPLTSAEAWQDDRVIGSVEPDGKADIGLPFTLVSASPVTLRLTATSGLTAALPLPLALIPDLAPTVDFAFAERQLTAQPRDVLALPYRAQDDYGVALVACQAMAPAGELGIVATDTIAVGGLAVDGRFAIPLEPFNLRPPTEISFKLIALDNGPNAASRPGTSRTLKVVIPLSHEKELAREEKRAESERSVARLIQVQQENLKASRALQTRLVAAQPVPPEDKEALLVRQVEVREGGRELLDLGPALGDLLPVLQGLVQHEMQDAVAALDSFVRAPQDELAPALTRAIDLETRILAVLRGLPAALTNEQAYQDKADLLAALQKLVTHQRELLGDTRRGLQSNLTGDPLQALVDRQLRLADEGNLFLDAVGRQASPAAEDDFARQLVAVQKLLTDGRLYEKMLTAADHLGQVNWPAGIQAEEEALALLQEALRIMNEWRVERARETIAEARESLGEIAEKLGKMEERQKQIAEVTRDLTQRGELDDQVRAELAKLDEEQKAWLEEIEKMAQDLYQFPELPVSNDLNSKMREVYEDVEQAADSENAPAVEIAVQKEDGLLEAIRNTKERVEDVEMWLPDVPDNIKWDLESFDAAEFPVMPLVELPEELEDIVGDLLDQSAEIDAQSQDSTGNQMMADAEMGWAVMDGPMPNFSAKGKSGNTKPNDNEMTGRSGAGREGQSTGELVENTVKGLEGRETHARKTNDAFQAGQVEEAEDSTLEARATGGGKLGGESETVGMFGNAPRRDLHMQGASPNRDIRQEAEATYAKARMLYMNNTQNLGAAVEGMRRVERADREQQEFASLQQRVLRQLQESQTELNTGAVVPLSVNAAQVSGGSAAEGVDLQDIDETFRGIVSDYYKNLGQ